MFSKFINQSSETDCFLQPEVSPPDGQERECMFKALPRWLHFSEPEAAAWLPVGRLQRSKRE